MILRAACAASILSAASPASDRPEICGFWERPFGKGAQLDLRMNTSGSYVILRLEIVPDVARGSGGVRLQRPMWLYLTDPGPGAPVFTQVYLAEVALQDGNGRPLLLETLELRCDRRTTLSRLGLARYDQAKIYAGGQGLVVSFLDPNGERRCARALGKSNHIEIFVTAAGVSRPLMLKAHVPVREKIRDAVAAWRRETLRARTGRCELTPPPIAPE